MKAIFLEGCLNSKLKALTRDLPEPMVPVMVKPLLERNMLKLKNSGINEIIICTHCKKLNEIQEYFGNGSSLGLTIHYIYEDIPLDAGGTIKNTEEFFNDTFILFYSNILTDIDINEMIKFHKEKSAEVTIAVTQVKNPSAYNIIEYNKNCYVKSFSQNTNLLNEKSIYINAGIYILEPEVLKEIPPDKIISLEAETYPLLLEKGYTITAYRSNAYWKNIDTIGKYIEVHKDILNGKCQFPEYKAQREDIYIGDNTLIHPSVKIIGPVYIGENVKIRAFSTIGPNTVIGNNSKVGINSSVINSIIWDNMWLESTSRITNTIITWDTALNIV